jgi:serine/threonine-protein kinase
MSPEQIRGSRCTAASDVFSVGIVFYQLATGRHPFSSKERSLAKVVSAIVFETPPKISEICPDAPEGLEFILNKAMEKDQANRIQNAGDLKQALSLCRITMKLGAVQAAPSKLPETRQYGDPPAAAAGGKPPSGIGAPPGPDDSEKTQVIRREKPPSVLRPVPPAPPKAEPPPPPPAPPTPAPAPATPAFKYCSICTTPNPPGVRICRGCGSPLAGANPEAEPGQPSQMGLYVAIGAAAILAIVLVMVLVFKG